MVEKISDPKLPSGMMRIFARAPIGFYRLGLGWVFGGRFLMLTHIGRVTGNQRNVVLEVVRKDAKKDAFLRRLWLGREIRLAAQCWEGPRRECAV